jgi:hypothetical protein
MNFYVSLTFLGIVLIIFSLVWVILDKKKVFSYARSFEQKKEELAEIITDAEQMIEELNKFSDYIVTQVDLKNEELQTNLKNADEGIKTIGKKAQAIYEAEVKTAAIEETSARAETKMLEVNGSSNTYQSPSGIRFEKLVSRRNEKVIPLNNRYNEALRLSENGMGVIEIAKMLNMGKGEIELILGINRN